MLLVYGHHSIFHARSKALSILPSATLALSGYWLTLIDRSVQSTSAGPLAWLPTQRTIGSRSPAPRGSPPPMRCARSYMSTSVAWELVPSRSDEGGRWSVTGLRITRSR